MTLPLPEPKPPAPAAETIRTTTALCAWCGLKWEVDPKADRVICPGCGVTRDNPFNQKPMRCLLCGDERFALPGQNSDWRCISYELNGQTHKAYFCPKHFPPDGSPSSKFKSAYEDCIRAIKEQHRTHR